MEERKGNINKRARGSQEQKHFKLFTGASHWNMSLIGCRFWRDEKRAQPLQLDIWDRAWLWNPGGSQGGYMFISRYWQVLIEETTPEGNLAMNLDNSATVRVWEITGEDVLSGSFWGMLQEAPWVEWELCQEKQKDFTGGKVSYVL